MRHVVRCTDLEEPEASPPGSGQGSPPSTISRYDIIYWPRLVHRDGVGVCIVVDREVFPDAVNSRKGFEAEMRMIRMIGMYDFCPGAERPPATPRMVARQVVEEFLPAAPRPHIAPGYAITGKPAYLETNGNLHPPTQHRSTVLGDIEVTFIGTYRVAWGDGIEESFEIEGAAWPAGTLTHVYTDMGRYDIVATIEWIADWRIGNTTGRIDDGLQSVGRIDDFEVRQLQAVRDQ